MQPPGPTAVCELSCQPIHGRRVSVDLPQVVVEEVDVPAGDLERRRAVAEDALQAEHVAAVLEERAGKRVPQDVRRAADREVGPRGQPSHDLLDAMGCERAAVGADEERRCGRRVAAPGEHLADGAPGLASDRHDAFLRALAHDSTAALDEIDIVDAQAGGLGEPDAGIEQKEDECTIAFGLLRTLDRRKQRTDLGLAKAANELLRYARHRHSAERVVGKIELALQPGAEGSERTDTPRHAARRERTVSMRTKGDKPAADDRWTQTRRTSPIAGTFEEADELGQVIAVPDESSAGFGRRP